MSEAYTEKGMKTKVRRLIFLTKDGQTPKKGTQENWVKLFTEDSLRGAGYSDYLDHPYASGPLSNIPENVIKAIKESADGLRIFVHYSKETWWHFGGAEHLASFIAKAQEEPNMTSWEIAQSIMPVSIRKEIKIGSTPSLTDK